MILGKINPVASVIIQQDPFNSVTVTGSYMYAVARPYVLGTNSVNFQVTYGEASFDESGSIIGFATVFNGSTTITGSDITDWGTNDAYMLDIIAQQQGTTVIEVVSSSLNLS